MLLTQHLPSSCKRGYTTGRKWGGYDNWTNVTSNIQTIFLFIRIIIFIIICPTSHMKYCILCLSECFVLIHLNISMDLCWFLYEYVCAYAYVLCVLISLTKIYLPLDGLQKPLRNMKASLCCTICLTESKYSQRRSNIFFCLLNNNKNGIQTDFHTCICRFLSTNLWSITC